MERKLDYRLLITLITVIIVSVSCDEILKPNVEYPGNFLIVAPKSIRPGLPYGVSVNILKGAAVSLTLKIVDEKNASLVQVQENVPAGEPKTVKFNQVKVSFSVQTGKF